MKKISKIILAIVISAFGLNFLANSVPTYAATDVCNSNAPQEVKDAAGCSGNANALPNVIVGILNAIILVCGLVAVIYVIIGGINYMTSAGDAGKLEKAKKTILYACIGLIIVVLSFAIVNFTISNIISGHSNQETTEQENTNTNEKPANT